MKFESMTSRLDEVERRIREACARAGRPREAITLIAVSKGQPVEAVAEAYALGLRVFGENYVQEWLEKAKALPADIEWHVIGALQTNKAKLVATGPVACVHSVDRPKLAVALAAKRETEDVLDVLAELNLSAELTKAGTSVEALRVLLDAIDAEARLKLRGLMAIPEPTHDTALQRANFRTLAALLEALNAERTPSRRLDILSMGMSGDFEVAIEEGATHIRVGTALFGARERGMR
ncbi:MAG: YggS family pyridoxal phosphate enzyme [Deltaproteobacteria bacterium CG2_30_63_29]|nr:MAG: YggS family pyridoxal phosphate enzyme [Deltaproteobacteria bacterium CG2_30_63_29]PJB34702.1 MAG: YggS family pyridoxal phosphate-dependent enzyme [Deltaproteobacteria bacterium CG_4_9_14_3_um_filter_63_12]